MSRKPGEKRNERSHRLWAIWLAAGLLGLLAACRPALFTPPRLAKEERPIPAVATASPLFLAAPTPTALATPLPEPAVETGPNPSLTVWINEDSVEHERALNLMVSAFEEQEQIDVELILVAPALLPKLMETAILSDTLPDVVLHQAPYTIGWAERGILNVDAADQVIDEIGRDTFDPAALEWVDLAGQTAAIPSDGYQQLLIFRKDWFEENELSPPDNYDAMLALAEATFEPEALVSGFVAATEANLVETRNVFEHIATANGCQLIDVKGEVLILDPACQEALDFYFQLISQYSPIGVQTDTSAQNAYLAGRTSMIMSSPSVLIKLAGLDDDAPPSCSECQDDRSYLAENSGVLTRLHGRSTKAQWSSFGEVTYLGITRVADVPTAAAFARYWFNQGYNSWLEIESERKVPMRWGTPDEPRRYLDAWGSQVLPGGSQSLTDIYGTATVNALRDGVTNSPRWALSQGHGMLLTELYEEFTFPVVLQEMLSGYFDTQQTLQEMYTRTTDLIPNYEYYREGEKTSTPEG